MLAQTMFLDIETIPRPDLRDRAADLVKVPANYKKPEVIAKYIESHTDETYRSFSLKSTRALVACIGYAVGDAEPSVLVNDEGDAVGERRVIEAFDGLLGIHEGMAGPVGAGYIYVGHNAARFDIPYLYHRGIRYGCREIVRCLPTDRYDKRLEDTLLLWSGGAWPPSGALKEIAEYLGIEPRLPDIDGSQVYDLWQESPVAVAEYCASDVVLTRDVYKRIRGMA